jgi:hypothetical protein
VAKDIRPNDPAAGDLAAAKAALIAECAREEENALYTSTNFFVWLRFLKGARAMLWVGAAVCSVLAASQILRNDPDQKILMAAAALAAVILPAVGRGLQIDSMIRDYTKAASAFKNLQVEFRRAKLVWSNLPWPEFKAEAQKLFKAMNDARKPSLTPPEWCFWLARRKIKVGHYTHDADAPLT